MIMEAFALRTDILGVGFDDLTLEEAVEDLRMLAKQGVSLEEMNEVLSSLLLVLPTPAMLEGVRMIYQQTPRWALMKSAVMH